MKKWKRRGAVMLLVIVVLVFVFWFFVVDILVKRGIESAGSKAVGAKVELAGADLTLIPFGVDLDELQVTNPDEPMRNIVEVEHIRLTMELGYLLERKIVGEEMTVDGVRFDTPRKVSGELPDQPSKEEKEQKGKKGLPTFPIPKLTLEDVGSILKKEKLQTLMEVEQFKEDIKKEQENYEALLKKLPNKQKLEGYKTRLKSMKGGKSLSSLMGASNELATLKKEIEKDLDLLETARKDLRGKVSAYTTRLEKIKEMPKEDFNRLKEKYSLSSKGFSNMALLLFGPKYSGWVTKGLSFYERMKPYLTKSDETPAQETEKDRDPGDEQSSMPEVLIRLARVSLLLDAGTVKGQVNNISSDQAVFGKPITFLFSGEQLETIGKLSAEGKLDRTVFQQAFDTMTAECKGYRLADTNISDDPDFPVTLKDASADVQLDITIENRTISSKLISDLKSVSFKTVDRSDDDPVKAAVTEALSEISKLHLEANLTGTLDKYDIAIKSDIDRVLANAVNTVARKQAKVFDKQLKQQITEKTSGMLSGLDANIAGFGSIDKELGDRLNVGDGLLGDVTLL